jgi:hypothetical protein
MWQILPRLVVILTMSALMQTSASASPSARSLTPESVFRELQIESNTIHSGEEQRLYTRLDSTPGELVVLTLSLTYPSGMKRTLVESTETGEATLAWTIPPQAGVGTATYKLTTGGCGCGYGRDGKPKVTYQSIVKGAFTVQ